MIKLWNLEYELRIPATIIWNRSLNENRHVNFNGTKKNVIVIEPRLGFRTSFDGNWVMNGSVSKRLSRREF